MLETAGRSLSAQPPASGPGELLQLGGSAGTQSLSDWSGVAH